MTKRERIYLQRKKLKRKQWNLMWEQGFDNLVFYSMDDLIALYNSL